MTNLENSFEYTAELEKKAFQACIGSLIELHSIIDQKRTAARASGKGGVWVRTQELDVYKDWMIEVVGRLQEHYSIIDRVNRNAMKMYRCSLKIREKTTPHLKGLAA